MAIGKEFVFTGSPLQSDVFQNPTVTYFVASGLFFVQLPVDVLLLVFELVLVFEFVLVFGPAPQLEASRSEKRRGKLSLLKPEVFCMFGPFVSIGIGRNKILH